VTLIVALATTFTAAGLTRYLDVKRGFGWGSSAQHSRHKLIETASSLVDALFRTPGPGHSEGSPQADGQAARL
jgi:hypothetical protein